MPWQKALGIGLSCIGLWFTCSNWSLAQSIHPSIPQPGPAVNSATDSNPATTLGANIDQILLPPDDDVPEEILRTEIIFEARSPLDGSPLSPADYAQLQAELAAAQTTRTLNLGSDISFILLLLDARRAFKPVIPFLP